jgi:hypothetical protein
MDADNVLSAVEMEFYMQFVFRSVSKEMVQKFLGAAVCFHAAVSIHIQQN